MDLSSVLGLIQTALELGLICSVTVLALYLSYTMLNVCDLSTDGCFTLGAVTGAGAKEQRQKQYDHHHCRKRGQQLILPCERRTGQRCFHEGKHRLRLVEAQKRRAVHNGNIDGVKRRIDDDPGKQAVDAHACLQNRHDQP